MLALGWDAWFVVAVTLTLLALLVTEKASYAALGIGLIVTLTASGVVDANAATAGFANKAVLTIAGLFVIGEGLTATGAMEVLGRVLLRTAGTSERRALLISCGVATAMSAFINDTAVVVVFLPILIDLSARTGIPASRLLMPLSFAALLGGVCTLVGTSTNIIVNGQAEVLGAAPLSMFSLTPVGVPMAVLGVLFMTLFARRLLPSHQSLSVMMSKSTQRDFVTELSVGADSPLVGRRYDQPLHGSGGGGGAVLCYVRDEEMRQRPFGDERVVAGDVIMVGGQVADVARLTTDLGLQSLHGVRIDPKTMELFEIALTPRSILVGERIGALRLHERYGATVMAVLRDGRHVHDRVSRMPLHPGDVLLVCGEEKTRARLGRSDDFMLLASEPRPLRLAGKARIALWITAAVIVLLSLNALFAVKQVPASSAALLGAMAMVASGALTTRRAFLAIDWTILVFIAGTLALGEAMRTTGVATLCATQIVDWLAPLGITAIASAFVLLCFLFNFLVSHSAVAVLFTPIALAAAHTLAAARGATANSAEHIALQHALLLAVCYGGSMCFATPIAHQVNLMVVGPGGYRYRDFLRFGLPVSFLAWLVATIGIPLATGV